jgi:Leu/Phe-tRNA-protein transferase
MPPHLRRPVDAKNLAVFANLPLRARVADRLSDVLLAIDESIAMCEMESEAARDSSWIAPHLRSLYDGVNELLNAISD